MHSSQRAKACKKADARTPKTGCATTNLLRRAAANVLPRALQRTAPRGRAAKRVGADGSERRPQTCETKAKRTTRKRLPKHTKNAHITVRARQIAVGCRRAKRFAPIHHCAKRTYFQTPFLRASHVCIQPARGAKLAVPYRICSLCALAAVCAPIITPLLQSRHRNKGKSYVFLRFRLRRVFGFVMMRPTSHL